MRINDIRAKTKKKFKGIFVCVDNFQVRFRNPLEAAFKSHLQVRYLPPRPGFASKNTSFSRIMFQSYLISGLHDYRWFA